jgi:L-lactate dehydrogenase (cytochrome)
LQLQAIIASWQGAAFQQCFSTMSMAVPMGSIRVGPLDEVVQSSTSAPWFQLYMLKDRGRMKAILDRAATVGTPLLTFTVDLALPGGRYRDARSGFSAGPSLGQLWQRLFDGATHPHWVWDVMICGRPHSFGNLSGIQRAGDGLGSFWSWIRANFALAATWRDVDWVRDNWPGRIVLKGIERTR